MEALSTEDLDDRRAEESVVQVWARHYGREVRTSKKWKMEKRMEKKHTILLMG